LILIVFFFWGFWLRRVLCHPGSNLLLLTSDGLETWKSFFRDFQILKSKIDLFLFFERDQAD
jgi:hypothetical protein